MARLFDDVSSEYLEYGSGVLTAVPVTLACWAYVDDMTPGYLCLMGLCNSGSNTDSFTLFCVDDLGTNEMWARTAQAGWTEAESTSGFSTNTWFHACGVFSAVDSRAAYLNGGSKGTDSTSKTPSGINRTVIGRLTRPSAANYMSGRIAEAAIWNVALDDDEVAALGAGVCPLLVRPGDIIGYWPLGGIYDAADGDHDVVGGYNMTPYSGPSTADHSPSIYPAGPFVMPDVAGAAGGITVNRTIQVLSS
jgi:hypothetical protein